MENLKDVKKQVRLNENDKKILMTYSNFLIESDSKEKNSINADLKLV